MIRLKISYLFLAYILIGISIYPNEIQAGDGLGSNLSESDTLRYITDRYSKELSVGKTGKNQFWSFHSLNAPYYLEYILENNGSDESHLMESSSHRASYIESYKGLLEKSHTYILPFCREEIESVIHGDKIVRPASLELGLRTSEEYQEVLTFSKEDLKDEFQNLIDLLIDSIAIELNVISSLYNNAEGHVYLPTGEFKVTKARLESKKRVTVSVKRSGRWDRSENPLEDRITSLLETNEKLELFFNEEYPLHVAKIDLTAKNRINFVEYALLGDINGINRLSTDQRAIVLFPNPTYGDVNVEFHKYPPGDYTLKIYNIVGKEQMSFRLKSDKGVRNNFTLTRLGKGSYLYTITDEHGKRLLTRRLIIIKP